MAIVLGTDDPVFSNGKQTTAPKPIPAPAPAPAPAAVYDYQQYTDPYTAIPDSQGYSSPVPGVVDSTPYWVNDPGYVGSGGGYTLDPKTGLVWIDPLNRWGTLTELQNAFYGAGTGAYGEYVAPGGVPAVPAPVSVGSRAPDFLDFGPPPPVPETVNIDNQVTAYGTDYTTPYAEDFAPGGGPNLIPLDMTPSSRNSPNITTSRGNIWDSTMQTWIDPNGYIRNPITQKWQTPDEYAVYLSGGTPSVDYGITRRAIGAAMDGIGGTYIEPDQTFDALGPFPGSSVLDIPNNLRGISLARVSNAANTAREIAALRDPSPYQFSAPPAPAGAPADLPDRANALNVEAYGVDPRDTQYVFSGIDPTQAGLSPGSIPNAWYALYPNGVQILLKSPTEGLIGVDDVVKASFTSFVDKSQADALAKIIVDAAVNNPAAKTGNSMFLGASLVLNNPLVRKNTEETISNAIQNNATPVGIAGLVVGGPISNAAFEVAYASTQTLLDNYASGLPGPVRGTLELAAGGLAAYKTGNIGAAGISSLPGMTPDAAKLSGRVAGEGAEVSLKLSGKEKVVTTLQGQKMIEEGVARNPRTVSTQLITENGVKKWVQVADPAEILNSNGTLRSGAKVISEVVSETPGQDAKTYLVMFDPISGKSLYVSKSEAQQVVKSIGYATTVEKNIEVTPDDVAAVLAKVDSVAPVSSDNSVINKYDSIVRVTDSIDQLLDNIDSGAVTVNRQEGEALMRQAMEASGLTVAPNATAEEIINELRKLSLDVSDEITSAAKANGIFSPDKSYEDLAEALRKTSVPKTTEVDKEVAAVASRHGIDTAGRSPDEIIDALRNVKEVKQELYNPATGKVVTVTSDNLADAEGNLVEAFRPSSLKRGDEVLLSRGTDGPDFASTTKYKVAEDTPFVEPGSSVRVTDINTGKSFNVEAGTIWRVSDANVDEGTILLNSGITLDNIGEMATSVWGGVTRVFLRNVPTEEGIRPGVLLHPKTAGIIGEDVLRGKNGGKQIIETAKYLDQVEIPNVAGTLSSQLRVQVKKLGRLRKTKDGAELALDIKPSKRDIELGLQHPFLTDVVEHYGDYDLTPEQLQAILNMNQLNDLKVQEQLLRGIKLDQIETELGKRGYMPHAVSRIGKVKMKETDLSTGRKLRIQLDRERQWETLAEGFTKGDVGYASFFEAFDEHSLRSLKRAGRAHIESLARIAGIDPAELANPVLKENQRKMTEKVLRLGKRVKQAEIRAGMYERFEQDMLKVYDDVVHAMPDEPVASLRKLPGVIKAEFEKAEQLDGLIRNTALPDEDRIKHASEWVAQTKKNVTMLKNEIGSIMDEVKNSVARDAVAQDHLHAVENRLKDLLKRADEIQAKAEPMEISRDILRKVKLVKGADRKAINADIRNLNNQIKKVRSEKLGIAVAAKQGVKADTEAARAARGVANSKAAAQSALRSISESADQRAGAQSRRAMERVDHLVPQGIERVAYLDNVTNHLESRIERLRGLGGKWKDVADQLYKDIDDAEQAKEFFKEAYAKSLSGANTKLTISGLRKPTRGNIDPLKNIYFQEKTAKMLEDYFADPVKRGWHWLPASTVNMATIPFQVTLDGSVRLATMGRLFYAFAVVDPKAAIKAATAEYVNAAVTVINKIARTSIESPAYFDSWRSQAEVAHAARFVRMRTGLNSQPDEFFFLRAGKRIPGLGKAMEVAELDFSRTGDRFMVNMFLARERALAKAGIHVDDAMRQKIGREISQLGGIPWNMASTDLERQLNFAANFFRSHLELHWSAMTKWGADNIDGHMARQDLATVYGMAAMIATVAAVKQGRDPVEVLSPFDLDAMRDGEIRWNPNFLTARINGFDQSLIGPWGSVIKLFATMGIGMYDTVRSGGDPKPLVSALYYAASTRGTPALKLVVDLMVGHDFNGRRFNPIGDPLSTAKSIGARWLPITFQNILADTESDMPWDMVLTSAITNYLGGTSAPVSAWELRDNYIRNMDIFSSRPELLLDKNRPPSWRNLTSLGKRLVTAEYGEVEVTSWDSIVRANRRAQIDREYGTAMQTLDKEFDKGNLRVDAWLEERAIQRALKEERLLNLYGNNTDYDERDPVQKYYKGFDLFIKDKIPPDWEGFEEWQIRNMSKGERDQVEEFFKTSSSTYTPVEARYQKASKAMRDAGYYDVRDEKFKEFAESNGIDPKMTRTEWQRSIVEAQVKEYMNGQTFANDEDRARKQDAYREWAWEHLNDNELVTAWNNYWYDEFVRDFIIDNPEAAIDADTFHKLSIRKAELELLRANATEDEMRASIQALDRFEEINDIPNTWEEKAWTSFEYPSDSGVEKKATRKETADAYKEQQAISTFSKSYGELTAAQKKAVDAKWDDLQDPWYKVDRSTRILNFLDVWDSLETDAERKEFLDVALSPKEGNNFNFLSNVRDLRVLLVANEQRKQLGLPTFDIIFEGAPISTKEAMWIVYREMGLSEADLAPR